MFRGTEITDGPNKILFGITGSTQFNSSVYGIGLDMGNEIVTYLSGSQHNFNVGSNIDNDGTPIFTVGPSGGIINAGYDLNVTGVVSSPNAFNNYSDYRIKKDVKPLNDTYTVDKLRPVSYYNTLSNKTDVGLIAHEIQDLYPFMVNGIKDGPKPQGISYTSLIGILIKEIQRLKERVDILENK